MGAARRSSRAPVPRKRKFQEEQEEEEESGAQSSATKRQQQQHQNGRIKIFETREKLPTRDKKSGRLAFADHPEFKPNLTPREILALGSFGGTYFRPIKSGVTGASYRKVWKEFPEEWFVGLDLARQVESLMYRTEVNAYGVKCGADLDMWESKGWIVESDPYGWFQWYCRFYLGRRSSDDSRQISRGLKCFGPTGRWRIQLCNRIMRAGAAWDDKSISPVIRQTLQHWGYRLSEEDFKLHEKKNRS